MLELKNLSFTARGENAAKEIVDNVSLRVNPHELLVITGPNGSGKSTLAKLIAGILEPTGGSIVFQGQDITHMSITDRARAGIGYAFQRPVCFKGITIKDLIALAAGRILTTEEACVYLSEVGLCAQEYIDREANASLSGGELKRIEIAMVLARGTRLSVFDEPEAGIDLWSFHNLIEVFSHLRERIKGSLIIISHQERILEIADRIVVLDGGKITNVGERAEILPQLLDGYDTCKYYKERQSS